MVVLLKFRSSCQQTNLFDLLEKRVMLITGAAVQIAKLLFAKNSSSAKPLFLFSPTGVFLDVCKVYNKKYQQYNSDPHGEYKDCRKRVRAVFGKRSDCHNNKSDNAEKGRDRGENSFCFCLRLCLFRDVQELTAVLAFDRFGADLFTAKGAVFVKFAHLIFLSVSMFVFTSLIHSITAIHKHRGTIRNQSFPLFISHHLYNKGLLRPIILKFFERYVTQ